MCDSAALEPHGIGAANPAQLRSGAGGAEVAGQAAGDEHTQHRMEPADRLGAPSHQVVVALGQQPQHRDVVLNSHGAQASMAHGHHRSRACIMRVGLVAAPAVEQPCPSRQLGRHVQHPLARTHQLLGQQRACARRALDRPDVRLEALGEGQQPISLQAIGADAELTDELLMTVEHRGGV